MSSWKNLPVWLKGGLFGAAVSFGIIIFSILWIILLFIFPRWGGDEAMMGPYVVGMSGLASLPVTFLLGVIIALVTTPITKGKENAALKGWKIGFRVACVLTIATLIYNVSLDYYLAYVRDQGFGAYALDPLIRHLTPWDIPITYVFIIFLPIMLISSLIVFILQNAVLHNSSVAPPTPPHNV